jgi:hypothetical protein
MAAFDSWKQVRIAVAQPDAGFSDDFEFPLHRGAAFRIQPVVRQIHAGCEFADGFHGLIDIDEQFQGFRLHKVPRWFPPRSGGRPGFSWPAW